MKIQQIKIENLKPYEKNAKLHDVEQIKLVANSIKRFGWKQPLVITKDNEIVVGHARYEAAKLLGLKEAPVIKADDLSEEEIKSYRLADNQINALTGFKMDLVIDELKGLSDDLVLLTGFDKDLLIEPEDRDDEIPEVPNESQSKLGDLYELGNHRILCGDSTKIEDVERLMDGKKADMVFTDPPYGMNLDADFSGMEGIGKGNKYENVIGDHNDFTTDLILKPLEFFGYCKEIFLWGADYFAEILPNKNNGSWIVWDKMQNGDGVNDKYDKMFGSNFELCWSKTKHKRALARILWKGIFGLNKEPERKRVHPTQKPTELAIWFLKLFSGEEDIVVDVYGGSGFTLIGCLKTNRVAYLMELDPKYVDVIVQRYCNYTKNYNIIKNGQKITWSENK